MQAEPLPLEILYEDGHILVIVKPPGLLVHPTKHVKHGTLANALAYHLNKGFFEGSEPRIALHGIAHSLVRPGIVHRLDRATSGLMVIAKTGRALSTLSRHFNRRLVKKRYLALVEDLFDQDEGTINAPIGRDPDRQPHWRVLEGGRQAETRFRVRERFDRMTLVELEPVTGRTNQLRIHCAHSGHPIIGDEIYGDRGRDESVESSENAGISSLMTQDHGARSRLCLHAWRLAFHHPANGEWLEFTSPLPEEIAALIYRSRADQ
ncbi:MAG TPA: RluA family pseudouridine synthase, partial [Blastocatellia bacterium]|jgi:23S rRNA pseudouridine1911/1915/1917 synthase